LLLRCSLTQNEVKPLADRCRAAGWPAPDGSITSRPCPAPGWFGHALRSGRLFPTAPLKQMSSYPAAPVYPPPRGPGDNGVHSGPTVFQPYHPGYPQPLSRTVSGASSTLPSPGSRTQAPWAPPPPSYGGGEDGLPGAPLRRFDEESSGLPGGMAVRARCCTAEALGSGPPDAPLHRPAQGRRR
jgi:hypothetical protein